MRKQGMLPPKGEADIKDVPLNLLRQLFRSGMPVIVVPVPVLCDHVPEACGGGPPRT
jgi:hypothetical protein